MIDRARAWRCYLSVIWGKAREEAAFRIGKGVTAAFFRPLINLNIIDPEAATTRGY
jgi:hypothetical protein